MNTEMNPMNSSPRATPSSIGVDISWLQPTAPTSTDSTDAVVNAAAVAALTSTGGPTTPPQFTATGTPPPDTNPALLKSNDKNLKNLPPIKNMTEVEAKAFCKKHLNFGENILFFDTETKKLKLASPTNKPYWFNNWEGTKGGEVEIIEVNSLLLEAINDGSLYFYTDNRNPDPSQISKLKDQPTNTFYFTRSNEGLIDCSIMGDKGVIRFSFSLTFFQEYFQVLNSNDQEKLLREAMRRKQNQDPNYFDGVDLDNLRLLKESKTPTKSS